MSSTARTSSTTSGAPARPTATDTTWLRVVQGSVALMVVPLGILATVLMFFDTTPGTKHFQHTADYWLTATGIPLALGLIGITVGIHLLQHGADGRLGAIGTGMATVALVVLFFQLVASNLASAEVRWGPSYPIATLLVFVGLALLAAGSWRTALLPRWILGLMPLVVVAGSFAAFGPAPLVMVVFLAVMAIVLTRRVTARA